MGNARKAATILVVDDEERNRRLLAAMLNAEGYAVAEAEDGLRAIAIACASPPDLVLLDIMMPGMDGHDVARALKSDPVTRAIPIVMVTALDDRDSRLKGLEAGAEEFVTKPVDRIELRTRVRNLLRLKELGDLLADHNRTLEEQVRMRTRQLAASFRETIVTMTRAAAYKDEETGAHVARISHYSEELARTLGMGAGFRDTIRFASPMHDIGKIAIPDAILGKTGPFDPHEWQVMKTHAALGEKMLRGTDSPYLIMGARDRRRAPRALGRRRLPAGALRRCDPAVGADHEHLRPVRRAALPAPLQAAPPAREGGRDHHRGRRAHHPRALRSRGSRGIHDLRHALPGDLRDGARRGLNPSRHGTGSTGEERPRQPHDTQPQRRERIAGDEPAARERSRAHVLGHRLFAGLRLPLRERVDRAGEDAAAAEPQRGVQVHEAAEGQGVGRRHEHGIEEEVGREAAPLPLATKAL